MLASQAEITLARRNFWAFCLFYDRDFFERRPFLKEIADGFQQIFEGKIKSLAISMPPRAGKSYITTLFVAWYLGKKPEESVMRNSATQRLYEKFSYDTRDVIKTELFKAVFPGVELADDMARITGWNLKQSRQVAYFGAGVGGTIIGFGASGLAITDDLYKDIKDAISEKTNENVQRWKESAHDSRLERNCPTIDIGTRWSLRDVIGTNTERGNYDKTIVIPALIEDKSFCDDVKTTEEYLKIRAEIMKEIWEAEYMQQPIEMEGMLFKKSLLKRFKRADLKPEGKEATLSYIDVADEGNDFFSMPVADIYAGGKIFITDILFSRDNIDITLPKSVALIKNRNIDRTRVESNSQGSVVIKMLRQYIDAGRILKVTNTTNKHTRIILQYANIIQRCYFLEETEYEIGSDYDLFMRQMLSYMKDGSSEHDDAVDSLSGLSYFIDSMLKNLFEPQKL